MFVACFAASDLAISRSVYGMLMKSSCDLLDIRLPRSMFNDLESASRLCYSTLPTDVQVGECVKDSETPPYQTEIPLSIADFENDTGLKKVLSATYSENSQVPPEENDEDFLAHELVGKRRKLEYVVLSGIFTPQNCLLHGNCLLQI